MSKKIKYDIILETQGKPEIVEATDKLRDQHQVHEDLSKSLGKVVELDATLHDRQQASRAALDARRQSTRQVVQETERLSTAKQRLEQTMQEANLVMEENSFNLEVARLEYETGGLTIEEYTARLQELKEQIANQNVDSAKFIRRQREINREIRNLNPELVATKTNMSSANSALFAGASALARINPQLGSTAITALSVSRSLGQVTTSTGGLSQAMQTMATFVMSPMGIVAGLGLAATAAALLYAHFSDLEDKTIDLEKAGESYSASLDDMIKKLQQLQDIEYGFFDTAGLEERLKWQRELTDEIDAQLDTKKEERRELFRAISHARKLTDEAVRYRDVQNDIKELTSARKASTKLILELEREIHERTMLSSFESASAADEQIKQQEEINRREQHQAEVRELKLKMLRDEIKLMESMAPVILDDNLDLSEFDDIYSDLREQAAAYLDFEAELQKMRIERHLATLNEMERLEFQKSERLRELAENDLIASWQRDEAELLILQQFEDDKRELREREIQEIRQAEDEITELKRMAKQQEIDMAMMGAQAISVINDKLLGGNRALAIAAFAIEKAVAIGNVILSTNEKAAQATAKGLLYSASPTTAWMAPKAFAAAAKIKATGYTTAGIMAGMSLVEGMGMASGGSGGGGGMGSGTTANPMADYRGISAPVTTADADENQGGGSRRRTRAAGDDSDDKGITIVLPDTLKITDSLGKLLTRMEYDRDASGEQPYLVSK